jgi:hypothetical protein
MYDANGTYYVPGCVTPTMLIVLAILLLVVVL